MWPAAASVVSLLASIMRPGMNGIVFICPKVWFIRFQHPLTSPLLSPFPQDLLLAAAFVSDAQYNRNIPFKTSPEAVR